MATLYDGTMRAVRDQDLVFWDGSGTSWTRGPTLESTVSSESDIVDLGKAQEFPNRPLAIMFEATASVSAPSANSTPITLDRIYIPGLFVQDAADGSTFSDILFVKFPADASYAVTAEAFSDMAIGIVKCRRYLRLYNKCGIGTTGTIRAWLRMGLTTQA
ncbi:MAG: hypothetical protein PHO67_08380 [Candidatus Omnitrophica bacterium]|nr:hypothetical protein [Candidatus Omnitrophota bacterium]